MSQEKRKHIRTPLQCKIKIWHGEANERVVKTRDVSDGGVFIVLDPEEIPPIGTRLLGQVQGLIDEAPILEMEVVRLESAGIGLRFVDNQ